MNSAQILNETDGSSFLQSGQDTLLRAALRAGLGASYECNSGGCGGCKFELLDGEIETLWPSAPGLSERDRKRGRHLACQCRAKGNARIKMASDDAYRPAIRPKRQSARLIATKDITHDIREFVFQAERDADFLPGQYAMLDLPGVEGSRAYSMANTGNSQREWHFQIRRVPAGRGTKALFEELQPGAELGIDGPYGLAFLRSDNPRDIVCVAGGSGLAPMVSIARGAIAAGLLGDRRLYFFYGARTPKDVCGENLLAVEDVPAGQLIYVPVVSQPGSPGEWQGATGFVHEAVVKALPESLSSYEFYFAGPPPMTQSLQELLMIEHKVPFGQIHFDRFF